MKSITVLTTGINTWNYPPWSFYLKKKKNKLLLQLSLRIVKLFCSSSALTGNKVQKLKESEKGKWDLYTFGIS